MSASGPSGPPVSSYCPLQILTLRACSQEISKTITASGFKLSQLKEDNE